MNEAVGSPCCPVDRSPLQRYVLDTTFPPAAFTHQCTVCGGTWVSDEQQARLLEWGLSNLETRPGVRPCPMCQEPMLEFQAARIRLDRCDRCKHVWFDGSELALVRSLLRRAAGGDEPWSAFLDTSAPHCFRCGGQLDASSELNDTPRGLECEACASSQPWGEVQRGSRRLLDHEVEVQLEHAGSSKVEMSLPFHSPLLGSIRTRGLWARLFARRHALLPPRLQLETQQPVDFERFFRRRGCLEQLAELDALGAMSIALSDRRLNVTVHTGFERAARVEALSRGLLECLRDYIEHCTP